ncbi:hypothetical protein [Paenibacillus sp. FSL H7-0331]|uniref:hypothetical protein n=1 Tax=Paenibacillus sp. FSL H7-0331 TaxID=1920421 RepID=UPI00096D6DD3|nr:hypothetical protein [Paenibacillus sp. FSL H7-0331]
MEAFKDYYSRIIAQISSNYKYSTKKSLCKIKQRQKSLIKQSLHESIFKNKVINIALLDPFDDSYISGVVVQLNDKDITIRNNFDCIKIPIYLIIGIL